MCFPTASDKILHTHVIHIQTMETTHRSVHIRHSMRNVNTFGHVVVHNEFEVFTAADHSHRVPLVVVELLSGIKNLRALA